MPNAMTFEQASSVLNAVAQQATGQTNLAAVDTSSFITVAQTALKTGYDPLMTAISQVLSRTIFSVRPYTAKFKGLMRDSIQYGNHVRKINYIDKPTIDAKPMTLTEGESIDQYIVRKPEAVQTNFYGGETWQDYITRYRDQLDSAFTGPEQFMEFMSGLMMELTNKHEQENEAMSRMALVNFIAGIMADTTNPNAGNRVVHLLTEYNTQTGLALTDTNVYDPANFKAFMQWVYSRIAGIGNMLTERSTIYHTNLTISGAAKNFLRHTPYDKQKVYLSAMPRYQIDARVLADAYHDNYLKFADNETVNYWQAIGAPLSIKATPSYLKADGTIFMPTLSGSSATPATTTDKLFGVIFDEEAVGVTIIKDTLDATPFNARGHYTNLWWTSIYRWWNDFTENGVVLLLD